MPPDSAPRRFHGRQGRTGPGEAEPIVIETDEDEENEEEEDSDDDSDDDSTDEHIDGNSSANQMRINTTRTTTRAVSTTSRQRENRQPTTSTIDLSSPFSSSPNPRIPESAITDDNFLRFPQVGFSTAIGAEKHKLSRLREVRSAAEAVMLNREILTIHAIAAHESIPKTRRRFMAQMVLPDDERGQRLLFADWYVNSNINAPPGLKWKGRRRSVAAMGEDERAIRREYVDVYESGDGGWLGPSTSSGSKRKSAAGDSIKKVAPSSQASGKRKERRSGASSSDLPSGSSSSRDQQGQEHSPRERRRSRRMQNDLERERQLIERTMQREALRLHQRRIENLPRVQFEEPEEGTPMDLDMDDLAFGDNIDPDSYDDFDHA